MKPQAKNKMPNKNNGIDNIWPIRLPAGMIEYTIF